MGRARPVRHCGGTDAILEALDRSSPGEVLVIDNDGRTDEACVGDLIALRAKLAGLAGIVIWGQHRDTAELHDIGLPVFSMGAFPARSQRVEAPGAESLVAARVGAWNITTTDLVMGDNDGVIFLPGARLEEIAVASAAVCDRETVQREGLLSGRQS
jgi:regulator of RNase E activity RraA